MNTLEQVSADRWILLTVGQAAVTIYARHLEIGADTVIKHHEHACYYDEHIKNPKVFKSYLSADEHEPDYWLYTIQVDDRVKFTESLKQRGVASSPVHARCDRHPAFMRAAGKEYRLPGLDFFASRNLAIPVGWWLTEADLKRVVQVVNEV